jgi:transposase InsO family protein
VPHDVRDEVMDFVNRWREKTELKEKLFIEALAIGRSKFFNWRKRYGKINEHNSWIPRDWWLAEWEKQRIIDYYATHRLEGYRRLTFMMLDEDVVAVSPSTTYRVLRKAGLLRKWNSKASMKGTGFNQPLIAHQHWHVDISYLNIRGTFYYLCSILDGYSRYIIHYEIREKMTEADVEIVMQRAREKFPEARPQIISDNGPQFIARDFKEFIRISGMTHVRTAPYYPQSNGKIERWHKSLKSEAIRAKCPISLQDAQRIVAEFVHHYNTQRLHSTIGFITPLAKLEGKEKQIFVERDRKLEQARENRRIARQNASLLKN